MYNSMLYRHSFICTGLDHVHVLRVARMEGDLVACMSHYIVDLLDYRYVIHVHVYRSTCECAIKGVTIKFCVSGSQNYLAHPTVGYPKCSDKWRPDT